MHVEWLYGFLETARRRSLSKASEFLNITQPALSKQIRQLEHHFGVQVFARSTAGVELTEAGRLLQERIEPVLREYESLRRDLLHLNRPPTLRLGSLPSLAAHDLPGRITGMRRQGIAIELRVENTSGAILALLRDGELDAGIVQGSAAIPSAYWSAVLFREPFFAVVPASHPLAVRSEAGLSELAEEPLIVYPAQCDVRRTVVEAFGAEGIELKIAAEVAFGESIPGFVAAGAGIAILPAMIAEHVDPVLLKAVPIAGNVLSRTIRLVSPKAAVGKRLISHFADGGSGHGTRA